MNLNLGDTQLIIKEARLMGLLRNELAYVLATAYHETAHTMKPVREYGGETYLKSKKYYPYVGMGYVQLTWDYNYKKASSKLGVDFMKNPRLLLEPKYAVKILLVGMKEGWFTGKKLSDYISLQKSDYLNARRIINGVDRAKDISDLAVVYENDLKLSGYGATIVDVPTEKPVESVVVPKAPDVPVVVEPSSTTSVGGLLGILINFITSLFGAKK